MIRGKKNYLPPVQLVYGFGYLFKLDESSIGNHVKRSSNEDEVATTQPSADDIESKIDTSTTTTAPSEVKEAQGMYFGWICEQVTYCISFHSNTTPTCCRGKGKGEGGRRGRGIIIRV